MSVTYAVMSGMPSCPASVSHSSFVMALWHDAVRLDAPTIEVEMIMNSMDLVRVKPLYCYLFKWF